MNHTPLHSLHQRTGADFVELSGWDVPNHFGDVKLEYRCLTQGVALVDRSPLGRFRLSGKDALDLLNRLTTNKVDVLPVGSGAGTILTTNKGRVIDLLHLFATQSGLVMLTSPEARARVVEWLDAYTFSEDITVEDVTENTAMLALLGPDAEALLRRVSESALPAVEGPALERYGCTGVMVGGVEALALRSDPLDAPGYDLIVPNQQAEALWQRLAEAGAAPIGHAAFNAARIEAGVPRFGCEMSEEVNPWEAGLQEYIHFAKGCYTGQEVILRLYNYDRVQRQLARLCFSKPGVPNGAKLVKDGKAVGLVTSSATHPITGEGIGLGILRKTVAAEDTEVEVVGEDGIAIASARVVALPAAQPVGV